MNQDESQLGQPGHTSTTIESHGDELQIDNCAELCMAVVEQRRQSKITTADTALQFISLLPRDGGGDLAYKRYVEMCTEVDREHAAAESRGRQFQPD
jgi:hypothetical protein